MDEKNLVVRKGVIAQREITVPFKRITDVYVEQDLLDVFLGLYDLHISTPTVESSHSTHIDGLNRAGATRLREIILSRID
jgi:membrane protein YdbS with pleckstrin-like domain